MAGILGERKKAQRKLLTPHLWAERRVSSWTFLPYLNLISMLSNHLHQPREKVRQGVCWQWLFEGPEYLEGPAGIVSGRAGEGCLQSNFTQLLLQVET